MITFKRYPHVRDLLSYYATALNEPKIQKILDNGVSNASEATELAQFIWRMADQMAIDNENNTIVLGRTDNSDLIPDVEYEISLYFANNGYETIWEKVCDES